MDSLVILGLISLVAELLAYSYGAYWAFTIRRALAVRLYRNQALAALLVELVVGVLAFYLFVPTLFPTFGNGIEGIIIVAFISLGLFYWVDASLLAARRSDPVGRDILHWGQVRKVLWALNVADFAYLIVLDVIAPFYTYDTPLVILPFLVAAISGAVLLPIAARRTKDIAFRRHLKWFGMFFLTLLVLYPFSIFGESAIALLISTGLLIFGGYCVYRSVRSLVYVYENEKFRIVQVR